MMKAKINKVHVNARITNYMVTVKDLIVTVIRNDNDYVIYSDNNSRHLSNNAKNSIINAVKNL